MIRYVLLLSLLFFITVNSQGGIVVLNGLTHIYQTDKGQVYKGKIEIQNTGDSPQSVKLYLQDLTYSYDGTIHYSAPSTNKKTNSKWIKLNSNLVNLKQKEKTEIFYEITVPDSTSLSGSYWSTIIVEPVEELLPFNNKDGLQITSIVRYAIQIITNYSTQNLKPALLFKHIEVDQSTGKKHVKIALENSGLLFCKPTTSIEIYNKISGEKVAHLFSQAMGLLPGTSKYYPIDVNDVPNGQYKVVLYATDQDQNTFALEVDMEI